MGYSLGVWKRALSVTIRVCWCLTTDWSLDKVVLAAFYCCCSTLTRLAQVSQPAWRV
jgi:hypothetical protein